MSRPSLLLLVLVSACAGRSIADDPASGGSGGGTAIGGGSAIGGGGSAIGGGGSAIGGGGSGIGAATGSGGAMATGGATAGGGSAGAAGGPRECYYFPAGPDPESPDPVVHASPERVWDRLGLFLDEQTSEPPDELPSAIDHASQWATEQAVTRLDAYEASGQAAPGLLRWVLVRMPELADPDALARPLTGQQGTLGDWFSVTAPPAANPRAGFLTDPGFLSRWTSISARGARLADNLFCRALLPPPDMPGPSPRQPGETRRQHLARDVGGAACKSCHTYIDPLGHALEHFDENGVFRELDGGQPVDAADEYLADSGGTVRFSDAFDLAPQLAVSCDVAQCLARSLLRYAVDVTDAPELGDSDTQYVNEIANRFVDSGFSLRELVVAIVQSPPFLRE